MSEELVFYTNPMSRGRIVRWMLEEVGVPYRTEIIAYGPEMKAPAYRVVNPMGKVPALRHGETVVTECPAILAYLADSFPEAGLAPPHGSPARGPYYRWLFFGAGPLETAWVNKHFGFELPESPEARGMAGWGSFAAVLDTLEGVLGQCSYLAGGQFSAADLYIGAELGFGMFMGKIDKRPAFTAYTDRLLARPARQRAVAIDDALMAQPATPAPA